MKLYTIGHSAHPIETFTGLLQAAGVQTVVDVRSKPYSRFHPQFRKDALQSALALHNIPYVYAGSDLGGRPVDPACYRDGEVAFDLVMQRPWFADGITRLLELAEKVPTAVLCAEEDPAHCHRHHLIAAYILAHHPGVEVIHLRGDGSQVDATALGGSEQPALF